MLLVLEYLPLILFFIFYLLGDIFIATGVLMIATVMQIIGMKFMREPVTPRHWIVMWAVLIFGSITLFLHDEWFVKIKVTVIYVAIALFLLVGLWWKKKSPLQSMLGSEINLPVFAWHRLTYAWVIFALSLAVINVYIAEAMSLDAWVNFKVFGILGATLVFSVFSGAYMFKHHTDREKDAEEIE
ncbi:septation protein IspZ [Pseudidiomarina gelatinasegens]|jgi:intracellular septation protein|uniref:Inner membrane-spanning protein YciB n=1 Tax=Pseudidiomarina gelatinasegens TaxID=2487740 RepID=A0A443Z6L1_9GAMM|nr:inner membrane-spanning protein YciB [Pseudidiomarina gelatinasegens]RWU12364.1 septation protein IspZ [Pseudidiomarina gelatinasegens]|tara:strand:+ start:1277 stop:1831 length:555 start_codon:yes stop_codon:yes gene_type:complete